jgi:hypothetical protein
MKLQTTRQHTYDLDIPAKEVIDQLLQTYITSLGGEFVRDKKLFKDFRGSDYEFKDLTTKELDLIESLEELKKHFSSPQNKYRV